MKKILFFLFLINLNAQAAIRYVNINATGTNAGTSWTNAFMSLQSALDMAVAGDQIWVAAGTYLPSKDPFGNATPTNAGDKTFYLKNGVSIYGGFVGTETTLNQRVSGNETILSGFGVGSHHVVLSVNDDNTTILDKLTITKGSKSSSANTFITVESQTIYKDRGAGIYLKGSNIVLTNVFITSNDGIGIYNDASSPTIQNAVFYDNSYISFNPFPSSSPSAIYSFNNSNPTIVNCTFFKNDYSSIYGDNNCSITIKNSIFVPKTTSSELFAYPGSTITISNSSLPVASTNYSGTTFPNITTSNNIFAQNPQFISESNLTGSDNKWATADDGLQLKGPSPCINTGTSAGALGSDITGLARLGNPEMGAYEYNNTCATFAGNIAYVNFAATGLNNGTSWANAFTDLEPALNASRNCGVTQIWVAKGTYKPTKDLLGNSNPTDPRNKTFYLYGGATIYGGFAGTETSINQRVIGNITILSGDIGTSGNTADNCYHVVTSYNNTNAAILDGLMIRDGNADGTSNDNGGGMLLNNSSQTLNNVTFIDNIALKKGGGIHAETSIVNISNTVFLYNKAMDGGGFYNNSGPSGDITNTYFYENFVSNEGGGLYNRSDYLNITNSVFADNKAYNGGGLYFYNSNTSSSTIPIIQNVTFSRNYATNLGGGMLTESFSETLIKNCIFWENVRRRAAFEGADIYVSTFRVNVSYTSLQLTNNTTNYSSTRFLNVGTSNNIFAQDPLFRNADNLIGADNRLMTIDDGLALQSTSPCLNIGTATGSTTSDITGLSRAGNPELGAYEQNSHVYNNCPYTYTNGIVYVNERSVGALNGTSWTNAYRSMEAALQATRSCGATQIWVAKGTYTPSKDPFGKVNPENFSNKTFYLKNGVAMYGGFAGTETAVSQRIRGANASILNGYIGNDGYLGGGGNNLSCYTVILSVSDLASTIVDGFTITKGDGEDWYIPTDPGYITVEGKFISQTYGGGIYNESSSPTISNVVFLSNKNGGVYNINNSNSLLTNVVFSKNYGGINNIDSNPTITNAVFAENFNVSNLGAGAISNDGSSPIITNAVFYANGAIPSNFGVTSGAGAISNKYGSNSTIKNCIFFANTKLGNATVVGADIENANTSTITISYSSLQLANNVTNYPAVDYPNIGTSNNLFSQNPLFVNTTIPIGVDNIWMTADDGLALTSTSPNIDVGTATGTPLTDILGNPRSGLPDMGAYEFQALASIFESIATGNWNVGSTWISPTNTLLPTATKTAKINSTHTVSIPNTGNQVKTIQMNGGILNLNGGTLEIKNQ